MTPQERQHAIDLIDLQINRYFDHYLTDVFPRQMDRMFASHNRDVEAHPVQFTTIVKTKRRVDRVLWMIAGGSTVIGLIGGLVAGRLPALVKALFP